MNPVYTPIIPVGPQGAGQHVAIEVANRLKERDRSPETRKFLDRLREMKAGYEKEFSGIDWIRYHQYVTTEKMYRGEQLGYVSPLDKSLTNYVASQGLVDPIYVHNIVKPHANAILSQWTQASTEINVIALPDQNATERNKSGARTLKYILDHYYRLLINERFRQRETQNGMFSGVMIRYSWWNMHAGQYVQRAIYGSQVEQTPQSFFCPDCQSAGLLQEAATDTGVFCPECGNPELGIEGGEEIEMPVIEGYQQARTGDLACLPVPTHEVKFDRSVVFLPWSAYIRWQFPIRPSFVRSLYRWWKPEGGSPDAFNEPSVRAQHALTKATGVTQRATVGTGDAGVRLATASLWWFAPCEYENDEIREPIELTSGEVIEPGAAAERFPNGLYICFVNNEPLDFYDANMLANWQHTPFNLIANSMDGDGIWDILQNQRELNDIYSMIYNHVGNIAGGGMLYDSKYIDRGDVPSKPYMLGKIKENVPPTVSFDRMVGAIQRPSIGADVFGYAEKLEEQAQFQLKTFSPAIGSPDLTGATKTLGGLELMTQGAQAGRSPELALRAMGDVETCYQWAALFQQFATDPMYIPFQGKIGDLEGGMFKNTDICSNYLIVPRPRSWIPKNESQRRADFVNFIRVFDGLQGLIMATRDAPALVYEAQERFDVTADLSMINEVSRLVRYRVDLIREGAKAVLDPSELFLAQPELIPDADEPHEQMIGELRNWKMTDEGLRARRDEPMVYAAVTALMELHRQPIIEAAQSQALAQHMAVQGQAAAQAEQQAGQAAADEEREERRAQGEMQRGEMRAEADHARTLEQAMTKAAMMPPGGNRPQRAR